VNERRFAIRLMIAQAFLFAAETAAIHHIGTGAPVMQLALIRSVAGVLLALALGRNIAGDVLRTRQLPLQLVRGAVTFFYMWVMIYSFAALPFADATAISYTQAAYISVFSVLILRETVGLACWGAAAIGLLGALLIAKPAFAGWNGAYLVVLLGTSLNGLAFVLNRYLQRQDSEATTMFYTNLIPLLGSIPFAFFSAPPTVASLVWLPGVFLLGPLGTYAGIIAVRHANAATLGPYTLLRLVIAVGGGAIIFRELPDTFDLVGIILIVVSCIVSSPQSIIRPRFVTARVHDVPRLPSKHTRASIR
jgi:drug/metabolite transporter (DMT)-like permease